MSIVRTANTMPHARCTLEVGTMHASQQDAAVYRIEQDSCASQDIILYSNAHVVAVNLAQAAPRPYTAAWLQPLAACKVACWHLRPGCCRV